MSLRRLRVRCLPARLKKQEAAELCVLGWGSVSEACSVALDSLICEVSSTCDCTAKSQMTKSRLWLANSRSSHTVTSCGCHASITSAWCEKQSRGCLFLCSLKEATACSAHFSFLLTVSAWQMLLNSHCCTGYGSLERKLGSPNSPPASAGGVSTTSKHPENRIIYESEVQKETFGKKLWKSQTDWACLFFFFFAL